MRIPHGSTTVLNHYRPLETITVGGQAVVLKGTDQRTGTLVTLKGHNTDPLSPCFGQELARAERCAGLRFGHPHIVDPIDSGRDQGRFWTVFPYKHGHDLRAVLMAAGGALPIKRAVEVLRDLASALDAVHRRGVVHRDVKAENILVEPGGRPYLIDFGIARHRSEPTITTGSGLLGTPETMAPEQAADPRAVDGRADLYSAGVVFYEMVTGQVPFPTAGEDLVKSIRNRKALAPSSRIRSVPKDLDSLCSQLLAPDPDDRPQSAGDVLAELGPAASALGIAPPAASGPTPRCLACGAEMTPAPACHGCGRHFGQVRHRLVLVGDPVAGSFRAPEGDYLVGRDQLAPRDHHMSRRQMRVQCLNGTLTVADAGAVNPTIVEGHPLTSPLILRPGAKIRLGVAWAKYLT